ncbi:MAG: hypothetical protein ACRYGF_07080 [Janthinobacterium lividum]
MTIFQIAELASPFLCVILAPFYTKWVESKLDHHLTLKKVVVRLLLLPWFIPGMQVALGLHSIWRDYHLTKPVTPAFVVAAAWDVSSVLLGLVLFLVLSLLDLLKKVHTVQSDIIDANKDVVRYLQTSAQNAEHLGGHHT